MKARSTWLECQFAPITGAWIETLNNWQPSVSSFSHLSRVRGLKLEEMQPAMQEMVSHLSRVRGLKH